jgi:branched-subunit amino acid transport protein AzlD
MNTKLTLAMALLGTLVSALVILSTRAFPFVLFSRRDPPRMLRFIEKYIPPMIMAILVVYCLKDVQITERPWGAPSFIALAVCVGLHLWKHNPMISIFGSTVLYMILIRIM